MLEVARQALSASVTMKDQRRANKAKERTVNKRKSHPRQRALLGKARNHKMTFPKVFDKKLL